MNVDLAFNCVNIFKFGGDQFLDPASCTKEELDNDSISLGLDFLYHLSKIVDTD